METRPYVSWDLIENFMVDSFVAVGVPRDDAKICADVLLESDRRGIESHGCNRFKPIYIDRINAGIQKPVTDYEILKETKTTIVADAHDACPLLQLRKNIDMVGKPAAPVHILIGKVMERTSSARSAFTVEDDARKAKLGQFFKTAHDLPAGDAASVLEGLRYVIRLHTSINVIDQRIALIRIKVCRIDQDTVQIIAVFALYRESFGDDISLFEQTRDISTDDLPDKAAVSSAHDGLRGTVCP